MENDSVNKAISVTLTSEIYPVEIRYTTDGSLLQANRCCMKIRFCKRFDKTKTQLFRNGNLGRGFRETG